MAWTLRYSTHQHTVASRKSFSVPNLASLQEAALKIKEIEQSLPPDTVVGYADACGPPLKPEPGEEPTSSRCEKLRRTNTDYKLI